MELIPPTALASAAETRRREMPASVALIILTGGIAAAIMGGAGPVGWAAVTSLLLVLDTELYRRLDANETPITGKVQAGLAVWAFLSSSFYALLPIALWLHGEAAGAAAAMVLWVAGVVRHFSRGASGGFPVALAGAAPPALSLLLSPLMIAAMAQRPDWDLAVIAAVGGGALMAYVTFARMSAADAERALKQAARSQSMEATLAHLMLEKEDVAVVLLDREGCVLAMSRGVVTRIGRDNATGKKFEDVIYFPGDRWREAFEAALKGEHVHYAEEQVQLPTGNYYLDWQARPWRDENGEIRGVFASARDITSLVKAKFAATADRERLKVALAAGKAIVWEVDYKGKVIRWYGDREAIFGEAFDFVAFDANTTAIIHDDDRLPLKEYFTRIAQGMTESIEHRVLHADGRVTWVETWAQREIGRSGGVRKLIVMSRDITDRKQQEAAFIAAMQRAESSLRAKRALFHDVGDVDVEEEASIAQSDVSVADMFEHLADLMEEMDVRDAMLAEAMEGLKSAREAAEAASVSKSQFLAAMSHELRTPLNAIIGYSEILREEAEDDGRASDIADIDRVLSAARQLLHLINDILDLSKIEAGRMDVSASSFSVGALIEEAAATVRPALEGNQNQLVLDLAADLGESCTDAFKLNQCLLNLLANAAKFTREGTVTIRAKRRDGMIDIAVCDTGIGMTEEQVARLFNAFVQADASTARRFGGTGLGLALTQRIMQLLGGDVSVTSKAGEGSVFTLTFPIVLRAQRASSRSDLGGASAKGDARVVLVIDDEESARDLAARSLTRLGFEVIGAANGKEGLKLVASLHPSLVLLDINLPDMSGWDVLREMNASSDDIPAIVHSVEDDRQRALSHGACDLLVKPCDRDVLAAAALRFARAAAMSEPAATPALAPQTKTA